LGRAPRPRWRYALADGPLAKGAGGRRVFAALFRVNVFRSYALVPHAYRYTPSRGSAATWGKA